MNSYTQKLIYYLNNKKFSGKLENYNKKYEAKTVVCGDSAIIYLNINKEKIVQDVSYENSACSLNTAVLELFCEFILNKNINEIQNFSKIYIKKELNYPESKKHCVDLVFQVLNSEN